MRLLEMRGPQGLSSKVSLLSKMAKSVLPCVRNELVRYMWHVITGFLQDDRMKPSTGRCYDLGGFLRAGPGFHCQLVRQI